MLTAQHRRPLAAFFVVFALACLIMVNGLRTQFVDVLIGSGAPRELITAIAPDMVLGQSLRDLPKQVRQQATREQAAESRGPVDLVVQPPTVAVTTPATPASTVAAAVTKPGNKHAHRSPHAARPVSGQAAPDPAPVATPRPVPVKSVTPPPAPIPARPTFTSPSKGSVDDNDHHHWGHRQHSPVRGDKGRPRDHTEPIRRNSETQDHRSGHHAESDDSRSGSHERGDHGDHGDRGDRGDHGNRGDRGDHGNRGDQGDHGNRGDHGDHSGHHR